MAIIRIPESAEPLLSLCRTSGSNSPYIWETYADMIAFLAVYAYGNGESPAGKTNVARTGASVDLGVFRNRGLYPHLLALSIAVNREWSVAKAPDEIAAITERFADAGTRMLAFEAGLADSEMVGRRLIGDLLRTRASAPAPSI